MHANKCDSRSNKYAKQMEQRSAESPGGRDSQQVLLQDDVSGKQTRKEANIIFHLVSLRRH